MADLLTPLGAHNAVMCELKYAISQRKEHYLPREVQALARARGLPPEEIAKEELDRTPFSGFPSYIYNWRKEYSR